MKPHKHAELIKAWADGAEIEWRHFNEEVWWPAKTPSWNINCEYRIKPEPKSDVTETFYFNSDSTGYVSGMKSDFEDANLRLTFDGETGELKSAEVLK